MLGVALTGCATASPSDPGRSSGTLVDDSPTASAVAVAPTAETSTNGPIAPVLPDEVPIPEPSTTPAAQASPRVIGGAEAAPPVGGVHDASQEAADRFGAWWAYEVQTMADWRRESDEVYIDGVLVCARLAMGTSPDAILDVLVRDGRLTKSGADGVVASALRSLCPHRNDGEPATDRIGGYQTYFDRQIAAAYVTFLGQWTFEGSRPSIYDMGWLAKHTCANLATSAAPSGLLETLTGLRFWGTVTPQPRVVESAAVAAANALCPIVSNRLGPAWRDWP